MPRQGKTGRLVLLSVLHEFTAEGESLLRERQDLVFRGGRPKLSEPAAEESLPPPDLEWKVEASAPLLFRFSALTFNAHRIHYDHPYAVQHEGYAGLVVHGPLQAALLLNQSAVLLGKLPARFDYRCTAPLIAGQTIRVASHRTQAGAAGRIIDGDGIVTIESTALDRETTAA